MKRRILLFQIIILGAGIFTAAFLGAHKISQNNDDFFTTLSGFNPGSALSYRVATADRNLASGKGIINEKGEFHLPAHDLGVAKNKDALTYDLRVDDIGGPLNVNFKIMPEAGAVVISGQTSAEFSNIKLEDISGSKVTGILETKSDWSGAFSENISDYLDKSPEETKRLKLALYSNMATDGEILSPYVIEIAASSGAGASSNIAAPVIHAMMAMTEQFSAVMLQQVAQIGMFFDAEMQLETQRELQRLQAEAHKDYHPSEQMCQFGSFIKTVAKTEEKAKHDKAALNSVLMGAYTNKENGYTSEGYKSDIESRLAQFRTTYCDPQDNNGGLDYLCDHDQDDNPETQPTGASDPKRMNKDIDFVRTVNSSLTLDIDFTDEDVRDDEEDVIALAKNLYWPQAFETAQPKEFDPHNTVGQAYTEYMDVRQLVAMQNVAHNSFIDIVSMKAKTKAASTDRNGPAFMKALMKDFGLSDNDINDIIGEYPSYYAQMEVLAKKIYQNPDFYTNLYTKPANIDRISVSMEAIKLMQARDQYESALRREMLTSIMLERSLQAHHKRINPLISKGIIELY